MSFGGFPWCSPMVTTPVSPIVFPISFMLLGSRISFIVRSRHWDNPVKIENRLFAPHIFFNLIEHVFRACDSKVSVAKTGHIILPFIIPITVGCFSTFYNYFIIIFCRYQIADCCATRKVSQSSQHRRFQRQGASSLADSASFVHTQSSGKPFHSPSSVPSSSAYSFFLTSLSQATSSMVCAFSSVTSFGAATSSSIWLLVFTITKPSASNTGCSE